MTWYQIRTMWTSAHWAAISFTVLVPIIFSPNGPDPAGYVLEITQSFLPLLGILTMASCLAREYESETVETLLATPYSRGWLILQRFGFAAVYTLLLILGALATYSLQGYLPIARITEALLAVISPALYLGSLAMLAGTITHSTAAGMLIPASYWMVDVYTKGSYTRQLYLFSLSDPRFSPLDFGLTWAMNKGLLIAVACGLLTGTIVWFTHKPTLH